MTPSDSSFSLVQRRAFTLIELLAVIAIITILASIVVVVGSGVRTRQSISKAKGEMQIIALALESFKKTYGDYPWLGKDGSGGIGTPGTNSVDLFNALAGRLRMENKAGTITLQKVSAQNAKPLVDLGSLTVEDPDGNPTSGDEFLVDPWGRPYYYFYADQGPAASRKAWLYPTFILLSAGGDGEFSLDDNGKLPGNAIDYFKETNLDNLIQGYELK